MDWEPELSTQRDPNPFHNTAIPHTPKRARTSSTLHQNPPPPLATATDRPFLYQDGVNTGLVLSFSPHSWPPIPSDEQYDTSSIHSIDPPPVPSPRKRKPGDEDASLLSVAATAQAAHNVVLESLVFVHDNATLNGITGPLATLARELLQSDRDAWRDAFASLAVQIITQWSGASHIALAHSAHFNSLNEQVAAAFRLMHAVEDAGKLQELWQAGAGRWASGEGEQGGVAATGWGGESGMGTGTGTCGSPRGTSWTLYHKVVQRLVAWYLGLDSAKESPLIMALRSLL